MKQLTLIRKDIPSNSSSVWINTNDKGLYVGEEKIIVNNQDVSTAATLGDVLAGLRDRSWFSVENKFIDISGNLTVNLKDTDTSIDTSGMYYYKNRLGKSYDLGTIKWYEKRECYYLDLDTSLMCINFLDGSQELQIIFPEDNTDSVNLSSLSIRNIIPGLACYLSKVEIEYVGGTTPENPTPKTIVSDFASNEFPTLFRYFLNNTTNKIEKMFNTDIKDQAISRDSDLFRFDLNNDGWLTLYSITNSINVVDYVIKSCYVKFKISSGSY